MAAVILYLLLQAKKSIMKLQTGKHSEVKKVAKKIRYRVAGGCAVCMTCIYECPVQAITLIPDVSAVIDPEKCIGCGSCFDNCQPGAIVKEEINNTQEESQ